MLTEAQRESWRRDGFFIVERFASQETCEAMLARAGELARTALDGGDVGRALVTPEGRRRLGPELSEREISKVFRIQRDEPVFREFCTREDLLDRVGDLLGPDLDCFLSQFIFKHPGALGQPWHQDTYYFPFDRRPQVGIWLAVTDAALDNGPLWVLPGSHTQPVHDAVRDPREHSNRGYVEIVDHDMSGEVPVLMQPGDLLLFHANLMHRSTDNGSDRLRAAMVYHYAEAGTVDHTEERWGRPSPNNDWMPVRRG